MSFEQAIMDSEEGNSLEQYFFTARDLNIDKSLKELITQRCDWERTNNDNNIRSTIYLYKILDPIYNMGCLIEKDDHPDHDLKGKFDAYCKARSIKLHTDTNYFVRLCAAVFGREKGSRYSAYGNALSTAFKHHVPMGGLISFLNKEGGIEEARRLLRRTNGDSKGRTIRSRANDSIDAVTKMRVASITEPLVCDLVEKSPKNGMAVLLVTIEEDRTLTVHAVTQVESIVDRVVIQAEKASRNSDANGEGVDED